MNITETKNWDLLFPANHSHRCEVGSTCPEAVVAMAGGFFITAGHCNFNSRANNGCGYKTEKAARAAISKLQKAVR